MGRNRKKGWIRIWMTAVCLSAVLVYNGLAGMCGNGNTLGNSMQEAWMLGSLRCLYPVMEYSQNPRKEGMLEKLVAGACYGMFPAAGYIHEEGERYMYATRMEYELPEELEEQLEREAANEAEHGQNGENLQEEDADVEDETLLAQRVLEQFEAQQAGATALTAGESLVQETPTGTEYSTDMLSYDFLLNHFYTVDSTTDITEERLDATKLLGKDMTMKGDNSSPQILIYHTHSQEDFVDSVPGDSSTSIVGVGEYLTKLLTERYGYQVIHNTKAYDLVDGKLDRNKAYSMALPDIEQILKEHPTIEVVIDLHRDGVEGTRLVTEVNGKQTAQLMFFNGLSYTSKNGAIDYLDNPNLDSNLAFSLQLQLQAAKYYPGATRKIYLKGYRYNLHVCPKALLVECGAQNNTLQEELNAMEILADVLDKVLSPDAADE